jgi:acetyl-CoA carboxylase biotin carboxylase subunit
MIGKLVTWGRDREDARLKMRRALREYVIEGIRTNLPFLEWLVDHPEFIAGRTHTNFVEEQFRPEALDQPDLDETFAEIAAVVAHRERMGGAPAAPATHAHPAHAPDPFAPLRSSWKLRGWR